MLTIGEIQEKLNKDVFDKSQTDPLSIKCIKRETSIKNIIVTAFKKIIENIEHAGYDGKLNQWQKATVERNIKNLNTYIENLYSLLDKDLISDFCKNHKSIMPVYWETDNIIFLFHSFYGSVLLDIIWATDISITDLANITKGNIDHKNLTRKLPNKIRQIKKEIIPYLKKQGKYPDFLISIQQSVDSYKHKNYKAASLLILVVIEGLVRSLGKELIIRQKLDESYLNRAYNSLDSFLRKIPWEKDIKIEQEKLMYITGDYIFKKDRKYEGEEKYVYTDLKMRLEFLRRTFRADRNSTLHGEIAGLGDAWDLYRNYSALYEVYLTIKYYNEN
jgi:hypothetical protein